MEAFTSNPHIFQFLCVIFKEKVDKKKTYIRKTHNSFGERKNLFKYEGSF